MKMKVGHYMMVNLVDQYFINTGLVREDLKTLPQYEHKSGDFYFHVKDLSEIMTYIDFREMECEVSTLMIVE